MPRGLSLYLDLMRFFMALVVVVGHSTFRGYTGAGFALWFTFPYLRAAVIGFFVLSGYVIAHVSAKKETTPRAYAAARISRLYSVVLPALLLTLAADSVGALFNPGWYMSGPVALLPDQPARYLASLLMLTNYWTLPHEMTAGTNGPFWSLSYEMTYYVLFGLFLLPARRWAWIAAIGVGLLAGPYILGLFPLWLLGVAVYRRPHLIPISTPAAAFLFVLSVALLFKIGWYNGAWPPERGQPWHLDYAEGVLFAVNILAVRRLSGFLEAILGPFSSAIRWLGMLTFAIYLCHRPLLQFFSALRIGEPGSAAQQTWLFGGTAIVIITIAHFSNWLRPRLAGFILGLPALRPAIRSAGD